MSFITAILIFLFGMAMGMLLLFLLKKNNHLDHQHIKDAFGNLSKEALDQNIQTFLNIAENKFSELLKSSNVQLDEKKKLIDSTLHDMKQKLDGLNRQTAELTGQMEASKKGISELSSTTQQLREILSSSQKRGQWGERMVEDILKFIGLMEGINYEKQTYEGEGRPDFTFHLPDGKRLNMDVKFPLDHYEKYLISENEAEKEVEKDLFFKDVRQHIKTISNRSYIDTSSGTLDYVLMFIPNESIYSFLNQEDKKLIDFSLEKRILLCSPVTLYAILSLIRQAVANFYVEQKAGEMQKLVIAFREQWNKFVEKLEKLGHALNTVTGHYEDLSNTRKKQLEKPMEKIAELQMGQNKEIKEIGNQDE